MRDVGCVVHFSVRPIEQQEVFHLAKSFHFAEHFKAPAVFLRSLNTPTNPFLILTTLKEQFGSATGLEVVRNVRNLVECTYEKKKHGQMREYVLASEAAHTRLSQTTLRFDGNAKSYLLLGGKSLL